MEKKIAIIGIGNCGSQVAYLAEKKYPELFDTLYLNSSDADLAMVNSSTSLKFKIGTKGEIEGSGKNREKMKEYLSEDINKILGNEDFQSCILEKKYCFIIASTAGGTGSGSAPVMFDICRQLFPDVNFVLVGVLPSMNASLMEQGNALEFLHELYDTLGDKTTYMLYDNDTTSNLSPTAALEVVNENIVEDIRILSGVDNYSTPYESIDEADMESIISTPGRLVVVRVNKILTEKRMEDSDIDEIVIKTLKKSSHCETDRNKRVVRWGVITFFTEAVNKLYTGEFDKLVDFIGTPIERFNHNAINSQNEKLNFLYLIASGMSPINDRVNKMTERIDELKRALAGDDSSKYVLAGDGASYSDIMERRKAEKRANSDAEINTKDIFAKFMKK